jgi:hypothetical protein
MSDSETSGSDGYSDAGGSYDSSGSYSDSSSTAPSSDSGYDSFSGENLAGAFDIGPSADIGYNSNASPSSDTGVNARLEETSNFSLSQFTTYANAGLGFMSGTPMGFLSGLSSLSKAASMPDTAKGWSVVTDETKNFSNNLESYSGGSGGEFSPFVSNGVSSSVSRGFVAATDSPKDSPGMVSQESEKVSPAITVVSSPSEPKESPINLIASVLTIAAIVWQFGK